MRRTFYGEPDYVFARKMLDLRTCLGLTQEGLAAALGITRKTIGRWESGERYPNALRLQALLALALQQGVFPAGQEAAQIRAFWNAAHQKVLLDETWLSELLTQPSSSQAVGAGGPSAGSEQVSAASSPPLALWTVPYARNPHFTGRDELLSELERRLAPKETGQPITLRHAALTQAQAIKGLGGIGKTQTAIEYAYRAREQGRYTHVFWINAASEETILLSFVSLAEWLPDVSARRETDQRKLIAAVIHWLEQCQEPWLLIVDNADDLSLVQPYLPVEGNGCLLFTTRAHAVGNIASSFEVDTMGIMEGIQLLLRRAHRFDDASDEVINEAASIVIELGQFPLALDQAGAYIEETGCRVSDYLDLYQQHRRVLLARRGQQATGYPESVATTWALSFERVQQINPACTELLELCALLAPDHIPEELLLQGTVHWSPALQHATADRFSFNRLLEPLLAFSLIKRFADERWLGIHRLVQAVQMENLQPEQHRQWAHRLVLALNAVFPLDSREALSWSQCLRYLEQVQACEVLIRKHHLLLPEAAEVLERTAVYLRERALYALAEPLSQQALSIWEQQVEPRPVERARSLNNLAQLSYWQDKLAQAEALYQQAVGLCERELGPEHLEVADSSHDLAGLYKIQGKLTEAEPLYLRALQIREQQLGAEHLLVAESLGGLAGLYKRQEKYTEAKSLYERALHIREEQLGPHHPLVAESSNDLAVLYTSMQEQYAEVISLYLRALNIWEQHFGPDHPLVAYALYGLATNYRDQGRYAEAEPLYLRVVQIRERRFGENHRNLSYPLDGLAELYRRQGRYIEAEPLFLRALQIREQQLGEKHPLVAATLDRLAHLYSLQDKRAQAEPLYRRALRIREEHLGAQHSEVALSLNGLANLYVEQGKYEEAEPLYQRALRIRRQESAPKNVETAGVFYDVARFRHMQGQFQDAAIMYQRALALRENILGLDHPLTLETRAHLQEVLGAQGQTQEASSIAEAHDQEEMAPLPNQMPEV